MRQGISRDLTPRQVDQALQAGRGEHRPETKRALADLRSVRSIADLVGLQHHGTKPWE